MSNVELSELVKKFQSIQRQDVPNQIGERNVIEIINVLRKKKLVDLIYTLDGKEYLTWDQLRREVVDEILINGGRMNVVDIPGSLNVHVTHIERIIPEILEDSTLRIESGEIITNEYLDSTIRAAGELLKEKGFLAIAEFAKMHRFTSLFAQEILMKAVESRNLNAVMEGNALYTKKFVLSQKVILRAGLLASIRPVNLTNFFERHNLFLPLLEPIIDSVRNELPGKVEGNIYIPTHFEVTREEQVENIYLSNGFIDYTSLHRQGISQAKEFLIAKYNPIVKNSSNNNNNNNNTSEFSKRRGRKHQTVDLSNDLAPVTRTETHPNAGHPLSNCFIADKYLANLVVLEDLTHGDTLSLDLTIHLPSIIDFDRDFNILLRRLKELHPIINSCIVLDGGVLVHENAFSIIKERLHPVFENEIKQNKKRKGKKTQESLMFSVEQEKLLSKVISDVTGLSQESYQEIIEELTSQLKDSATDIYNELLASAEHHGLVDLKRIRSNLQSSLASAWIDIIIVLKGLHWAASQFDEATFIAMNRHILNTRALPMVKDILLNESLDTADLYERIHDAITIETQPTIPILQKALRILPEGQRKLLLPIIETLNSKSVESFTSLLQEKCSTGEIAISTFHQPNKKIEREALVSLKRTLKEKVENNSFNTDVMHSSSLFASLCDLLVCIHFNVYVELPGRVIGNIVARLLKESEITLKDLQECNQIITSAISGGKIDDESFIKLEMLRKMTLGLL